MQVCMPPISQQNMLCCCAEECEVDQAAVISTLAHDEDDEHTIIPEVDSCPDGLALQDSAGGKHTSAAEAESAGGMVLGRRRLARRSAR